VAAPATCPVAPRARIRRCRLPTGSPYRESRDEGSNELRAVALDVHPATSAGWALVEEGELRSVGRIETKPEALELFAQSLDCHDHVVLEVTGNAWAIARIIEPHVARVIVVSPSDTGYPAGAGEDRSPRRSRARQAALGGSARRGLAARRTDQSAAPAAEPPYPACAGAHAREERRRRGALGLPRGPPTGVRPLGCQG
jgi:hypothetical protein